MSINPSKRVVIKVGERKNVFRISISENMKEGEWKIRWRVENDDYTINSTIV